MSAGLAKPASARLEAAAPFGQPIFILVATNDDASLLLPRDRRVFEHGRPADVLDAVAGVPLDAARLRSVVTGCAGGADPAARSLGENWRAAMDGGDDLFFRRDAASAPWRLVATIHGQPPAWRAEYSAFENNLPRAVRLVSEPAGRFDLQLDLSQVELNVPLGAEAFQLLQKTPADPITLDELRRSGPLGEK